MKKLIEDHRNDDFKYVKKLAKRISKDIEELGKNLPYQEMLTTEERRTLLDAVIVLNDLRDNIKV